MNTSRLLMGWGAMGPMGKRCTSRWADRRVSRRVDKLGMGVCSLVVSVSHSVVSRRRCCRCFLTTTDRSTRVQLMLLFNRTALHQKKACLAPHMYGLLMTDDSMTQMQSQCRVTSQMPLQPSKFMRQTHKQLHVQAAAQKRWQSDSLLVQLLFR